MKKPFLILTLLLNVVAFSQSTWYEINTPTNKQLNTISFASEDVGYIGGNDSLLLKTTDGGKTWTELSYSGVTFFPMGEHIVNLKFTSETTGYMCVGPYTGTYKTEDGGLTWTEITFTGNMCYNQGLYFWDNDNGIIGGSGCFQGEHIEQYNAGTLSASTINTSSLDATNIVIDIDFLDADYGLAVSKSRFLRTTDGGSSWDTIPSGTPNFLTSVQIINDTLAYAGYLDTLTAGYGVLMSTDSGMTWTEDLSMATFFYPDYYDVGKNNSGYIYVAAGEDFGNQGLIFENKGSSWNYTTVDHQLRAIDHYGDSTVFMVGDSGYVVTNVDPATLSVESFEEEISIEIFPNPASDQLSIKHDLSKPLTAAVYDLSGKRILDPMAVNGTINISALKPGMYVLKVQTGDQTITKKFMKE